MKIIDKKMLEETIAAAKASPRRRHTHVLHESHSDPVQRMLNAIEPDSYVRPHKHFEPDKTETFLILKGRMAVIIFNDTGKIAEIHMIEAGGEKLAVNIPPRAWHSAVSLESGSVIFEVKEGPYVPSTDKNFAPWAPEENAPEAEKYLAELKEKIRGD